MGTAPHRQGSLLAVTGVVFAFAQQWWVLAIVALGGALSTEVVESGPFTSIEQAMLATDLRRHERRVLAGLARWPPPRVGRRSGGRAAGARP